MPLNLPLFMVVILLVLPGTIDLQAQTCCSGGVPLSGNLGLPAADQNSWQFALSYDLNVLKTLKVGTEKLDERNRERVTHSLLFETGYTFTERFSVDLFASYVRQERNISNPGLPDQNQHTDGFGDAVILLKYRIIHKGPVTWTLGAGPKLPTGASDITNNGILVGADLQPGSGAWDGIAWSYLLHQPGSRKSMNLSLVTSMRLTGTNQDFRQSQSYKFGSEFQIIAGISDRVLLGELLVDPSLSLRYRRAFEDQVDGNQLPNTGGQWIFIYPAIGVSISSRLTFNLGFEVPLYADITGTQLTPTYRINTGFYYIINRSTNLFNLKLQQDDR
ncbi:MAG: hypothetical protein DHS20C17_00020 [Cyclobacteriaceae bacterium]|nr:MAG: hypothetical protein DHS20C17_00020 [Cyclobacteriaceae bacterium]